MQYLEIAIYAHIVNCKKQTEFKISKIYVLAIQYTSTLHFTYKSGSCTSHSQLQSKVICKQKLLHLKNFGLHKKFLASKLTCVHDSAHYLILSRIFQV